MHSFMHALFLSLVLQLCWTWGAVVSALTSVLEAGLLGPLDERTSSSMGKGRAAG